MLLPCGYLQGYNKQISYTIEKHYILINQTINNVAILKGLFISLIYFFIGVAIFYAAYFGAKIKGTLINIGE